MKPAQRAHWFIESHVAGAPILDELAGVAGITRPHMAWHAHDTGGDAGSREENASNREPKAPVLTVRTDDPAARGCFAQSMAADCLASAGDFVITRRNETVARAE